MLLPEISKKRERRDQLLRMEFRAFLQNLIWIPCQIVTRGRQIIYRVLGYNRLPDRRNYL